MLTSRDPDTNPVGETLVKAEKEPLIVELCESDAEPVRLTLQEGVALVLGGALGEGELVPQRSPALGVVA